ncbi:MAG: hypothetical protein KDD66_17225 [Bdellovibrionales bacterium]|nr:hypothetical protein [Bdellovibrionales bacterium]
MANFEMNKREQLQLTQCSDESQLEIGKTYPFLGIITEVFSRSGGQTFIKINDNITARVYPKSLEDDVETLREHAFETAIFNCRVVRKDPNILVECESIIFGEHPAYHA